MRREIVCDCGECKTLYDRSRALRFDLWWIFDNFHRDSQLFVVAYQRSCFSKQLSVEHLFRRISCSGLVFRKINENPQLHRDVDVSIIIKATTGTTACQAPILLAQYFGTPELALQQHSQILFRAIFTILNSQVGRDR